MTPDEEDALIESSLKATVQTNGTTFFVYSSKEAMRLAIRAAYEQGVAQERERAANCCVDLSACVMPHAKDYFIECAAAIRRG